MTTRPHPALTLLLGTAVVCLTGCGGGHARPSAGIQPPSPSSSASSGPSAAPIGTRTSLPWWSEGTLHVDGRTIRTPLHEIVSRGGTTAVGRTTRRGSTWRVVRGSRLVPVISTRQQYVDPVVSANGRHLAWVESRTLRRFNLYTTEQVFTIHAYDVGQGRQTGTTSVESRVTCCDAGGVYEVAGVDNDGTVVAFGYTDPGHVIAWRPGHSPVDVRGIRDAGSLDDADQWPGGVSFQTVGDSSGPAVFARVMPGGGLIRLGGVPQAQGGTWSPDGTAYVYQPFTKAADHPQPVVQFPGRQVRLHVHGATGIVGWESRRSVIVLDSARGPFLRGRAVLVRCDARSGRCEQAGPVLHHAVLPRNGP